MVKSSFRTPVPNVQVANKTAYEPQKLDVEFADGFEEVADHFSEPPARFKKQQMEAPGEQLSFGTKTDPGNAGRNRGNNSNIGGGSNSNSSGGGGGSGGGSGSGGSGKSTLGRKRRQ